MILTIGSGQKKYALSPGPWPGVTIFGKLQISRNFLKNWVKIRLKVVSRLKLNNLQLEIFLKTYFVFPVFPLFFLEFLASFCQNFFCGSALALTRARNFLSSALPMHVHCFKTNFLMTQNADDNQIQSINGRTFDKIPLLTSVNLRSNECIDDKLEDGQPIKNFTRKITENCAFTESGKREFEKVFECGVSKGRTAIIIRGGTGANQITRGKW